MKKTAFFALILATTATTTAFGVDYTVTVPNAEQARVEAAFQKGYKKPVAQVLAEFVYTTVKNIEVSQAMKDAADTAKASKESDIESKIIVTPK